MAINRQAALDYAKKYWSRVLEDGLIGTSATAPGTKPVTPDGYVRVADMRKLLKAPESEGWEPVYLRHYMTNEEVAVFTKEGQGILWDPQKYPPMVRGAQLEDCTHYVSHCLISEGIDLAKVPFDDRFRAAKVAEAMLNYPQARTLAKQTTQQQGQKVIDSGIFKPGDFIAYHKKTIKRYGHTAMYVGKTGSGDAGGITCHSTCRYHGQSGSPSDDYWYLNPDSPEGLSYTLIHFTEDDRKISPATRQWLTGWWQVGNNFYYVWEDGRAFSTLNRPQSDHALAASESVGHYFEDDKGIILIWSRPAAVQVERWTRSADSGQPALTIDGTKASATRMTFGRK